MAELHPSEVLCIPKRRRLVRSRLTDATGHEVLHVFYGEKELVFDEPDLVPFGERLVDVERFRAEEAMSWSAGSPYAWETVRGLLEELIDQEILKRVTAVEATAKPATAFPARLGLAPADRQPRTFSAHDDQCPAITEEAFGRAVDLSNLEVLVPIYRVAHPAMDRDGRQVGENNVTPRMLFLDPPTQRRLCSYAGSRYQADGPMNVTALKAMTSRWPELLSLTQQFREALFARMPPRDPAALRVGEVHLLTVCSLAAVGYVMVRGKEPVPNGQLDPGLASMFRLIDGVRLVTNEMMRATAGEHGCDRRITAKDIADYAERYSIYYGPHGVCAGPQALIDEYLQVLFGEASAPIRIEPDLAARLGDLAAALDYGLIGQRMESIVRTFGSAQGLLHERLRAAFEGHASPRTKLQDLVEAPIDVAHYALLRDDHPLPETLKLEIELNRWLYERAGEALPEKAEGTPRGTEDLLHLDRASQADSRRRLDGFFTAAVPDYASFGEGIRQELTATAADVFALERRCLRAVAVVQRQLNERVERKPGRALTSVDLAAYNRPRTGPPFESTLAEGLGLTVLTDAATTVLRCGDHTLTLTD